MVFIFIAKLVMSCFILKKHKALDSKSAPSFFIIASYFAVTFITSEKSSNAWLALQVTSGAKPKQTIALTRTETVYE